MGALTRVVMDWLDRLIKYHELNGVKIEKYPKIGESGQVLMYYSLKQAVDSLGGFAVVSKENLWKEVCSKLSLQALASQKKQMETALYKTYLDVILPFEAFLSFLKYAGIENGECRYRNCNLQASKRAFNSSRNKKRIIQQVSPKMEGTELKQAVSDTSKFQLSPSRQNNPQYKAAPYSPPQSPVSKIAKRLTRRRPVIFNDDTDSEDYDDDSESPSAKRRRTPQKYVKQEVQEVQSSPAAKRHTRALRGLSEKALSVEPEPQLRRSQRESVKKESAEHTRTESSKDVEEEEDVVTICEICEQECPEDGELSVSCKECEGLFHISCISSSEVFLQPSDKSQRWFCSRCLVGSCEFAFEPGPVYSLGDFQDLAEDFRDDYLEKNPELEDLEDEEFETEIEKRFWKSVNATGESITVEYGSDIHCSDKGSGFPVRAKDPYNRYSKDPWNLNNMPHHRDSLFHQIKSDISGMTVPWLYVGMMFSTFCWHSEDHYTYSVNYQHFGDTKTWYGIPGYDAEKFEAAMRSTVPELFEKQPNLLFQLVTMLSPEVLLNKGVHCYAIDQGPGEFVITFPKAYHAGFNHGFNCNEAVNFAPPDWVSYGAESVETYQKYNRAPVFSHDSLVLRTAKVDVRHKTACWLYPHIDRLVEKELAKRKFILSKHPHINTEYISSEVSEEEYQCCICNSLPYLSRVTISRDNLKTSKSKYNHQSRSTRRSATTDEKEKERDTEDQEGMESDTDLMESVFGAPASSYEEGDELLKPRTSITVCHLHIPETPLPKGVSMKLQLMCSNDELIDLRNEILRRRDEDE